MSSMNKGILRNTSKNKQPSSSNNVSQEKSKSYKEIDSQLKSERDEARNSIRAFDEMANNRKLDSTLNITDLILEKTLKLELSASMPETTEEIVASSFLKEICNTAKHNLSHDSLNEKKFNSSDVERVNTKTSQKKKSKSDSGFIPAEEAFLTANPCSFNDDQFSGIFNRSVGWNCFKSPGKNYSVGDYFKQWSENPFSKEESPERPETIPLVDQSKTEINLTKKERSNSIPEIKTNTSRKHRRSSEDDVKKIKQLIDNFSTTDTTDQLIEKFQEFCRFSSKSMTNSLGSLSCLSDNVSDSEDSIMRLLRSGAISASISPRDTILSGGKLFTSNEKKKDKIRSREETQSKLMNKTLNESCTSGKQHLKLQYADRKRSSSSGAFSEINSGKENDPPSRFKPASSLTPPQLNSKSNTSSKSIRCPSQCSSLSDFDVARHGTSIPIKISTLQVSWESTKLRTSIEKIIQMKNTSTKRLTLKLTVSGPGFHMKENSNILVLQSQECRSISIVFNPTVIGPAEGKLNITLPESSSSNHLLLSPLTIPLFGYGGIAKIGLDNVLKGPDGSKFISLGNIHQFPDNFVKSFTIYNKGPLNGFAVIIVNIENIDKPLLRNSLIISPIKTIIPPESSVEINVEFVPRKEYLKKFYTNEADVKIVATLEVIYGDEPTRKRVQNVIRTMTTEEKSNFMTSSDFDSVWNGLPNEEDSISASLKEDADLAINLVNTFKKAIVKLTITRDNMDETQNGMEWFYMNDSDETILFRTIIPNN